MPRASIERHIPWPRDRTWRPGEPITLTDEAGATITYRLRGVMRDTDPGSAFALVSLEPLRTIEAGAAPEAEEPDRLPAAG